MATVEVNEVNVTDDNTNSICIRCKNPNDCQYFYKYCNLCFQFLINKYIISFNKDENGSDLPLVNLQINKSFECPVDGCDFHTWVKYENQDEVFFHSKMPSDDTWGKNYFTCEGEKVEKNNTYMLYSKEKNVDEDEDDEKEDKKNVDKDSDDDYYRDDYDDAYEVCDICDNYRCTCDSDCD